MSHFTKLDRAKIKDADAFVKACAELGLTSVQRNVAIRDFYGKQIDVDVAVKAGEYDLALKKNAEGSYDMVADWWGVRGSGLLTRKDIKNDADLQDFLLRTTTKHTIVSKYRSQGFHASVTEDENQNINVVLQRAY